MGKQSKKKQRKNKSPASASKHSHSPNNNNNNKSSQSILDPHHLVTARIRHGDPKVSAGALSGLSHTLFSPDALQKQSMSFLRMKKSSLVKNNKNRISEPLLKAISEKILDKDNLVAKNAAGCWNNYILFYLANFYNDDNSLDLLREQEQEHIDVGSILLLRIHQCSEKISSAQKYQASSSSSATPPALIKLSSSDKNTLATQWDVMHVCLQTLCALIENTPTQSTESIFAAAAASSNNNNSRNSKSGQVTDILSKCLSLSVHFFSIMHLQHEEDQQISTTHSQQNNIGTSINQMAEIIGGAMTWISRSLHSVLDDLDDNATLCQHFLSSSTNPPNNHNANNSVNFLNVILSIFEQKPTNMFFPSKVKLHLCGVLVCLLQCSSSVIQIPPSITSDIIIPTLQNFLVFNQDQAKLIISDLSSKYEKLKKEIEDEEMEMNIIKKIKNKKESARSIAKRQKQEKALKKQKQKEEREKETEMMQEDRKEEGEEKSETTTTTKKGKIKPSYENAQDEYDSAVQAWKDASSQLKLALEITTNFSVSIRTKNNKAKDEDMMDEMEDQEEEEEELDEVLLDKIMGSQLPEKIVSLFNAICTTSYLESSVTRDENKDDEIRNEASEMIHQDLSNLSSKASASMGNLAFALISMSKKSGINTNSYNLVLSELWKSLFTAASSSTLFYSFSTPNNADNGLPSQIVQLNSNTNVEGMAGITSTLMSILRCYHDSVSSKPKNNNNNNGNTIFGVSIQQIIQWCLAILKSLCLTPSSQQRQNNNQKEGSLSMSFIEEVICSCISIMATIYTFALTTVSETHHQQDRTLLNMVQETTKSLLDIYTTTYNCKMRKNGSSSSSKNNATNHFGNNNNNIFIQNEIINALVDIYGCSDDPSLSNIYDGTFNLNKVLSNDILPSFHSNIVKLNDLYNNMNTKNGNNKKDEEQYIEYFRQWSETEENLEGFIEYKEKEMR